MIAKLYGADCASLPYFEEVRNHALHGNGELQSLNYLGSDFPLGEPVDHNHVFRITIIKTFNCYNIVMYSRFYDLPIENVLLGSFDKVPDFYKDDVYIHCDYNNNKIRTFSKSEHKKLTNQVSEKMPRSIIIWFVIISTLLISLFIYLSSMG